ncbi:UvrABC system protein A [Bacteroidia bacterium]|nr:UvrABC system protein A [Bacteroidia bacterium]
MDSVNIKIQGARVNNLKNISVEIPRNKLVVITGLSGSGKSSLAFDTLYAEGQRRYVESLSAYARQFLGKINKPEVNQISGISPAIAIEQKTGNYNPRSTVGTSTEIYEYLKLLYARIGRTISPVSGKEVTRDSVSSTTDSIFALPEGTKIVIFAPFIVKEQRSTHEQLQVLQQMGFSRMGRRLEDDTIETVIIDDVANQTTIDTQRYLLLIDRLILKPNDPDLYSRIFESIQTAFHEGVGECLIQINGSELRPFSNRFELDGMVFEKPNENFFSFNNPYGACKTCEGYGSIIGISEDLVIPNPSLSVYEDAVAVWRGEKMSEGKMLLIKNAERLNFPIHKPYNQLTPEQKHLLWYGAEGIEGIYPLFKWIETQTYKIQYRVMLARYKGKTQCPDCQGSRLRHDTSYVKIVGKSILDLVMMPIDALQQFFNTLKLSDTESKIVHRILQEINSRLQFLMDVGLNYLTLNRLSSSLSGGEAQRINLATSLGSALVGSLYILDEPSIGLHSRDTARLIEALKHLRDLGNTVIIVEHDEEIIRAADEIIDIGPLAGIQGGTLVFQGNQADLKKAGIAIRKRVTNDPRLSQKHFDTKVFLNEPFSLTAAYLDGTFNIPQSIAYRKWKHRITLKGACEHNLKNVDVQIPLGVMTVVTGVSGSGKTTLIRQTLYPALKRYYGGSDEQKGRFSELNGDLQSIANVELVDQNPIGRSSRSNPATYVKAYDDIRNLFANQPLAKTRNYKPGFFSFNTEGGRCETCQGEGEIKVKMQFMADVSLVCEECQGTRFKDEVLEIKYHDKNISDILNLSIEEVIEFFKSALAESPKSTKSSLENAIIAKLQPLQDVGLGYLKLGQSSSSLSGGEAQRVKLAYFLTKSNVEKPTLFFFDEPTTGLHLHDILKLKQSFDALIDKGHTIVVIEHHPDLIKTADHIIDMGPDGGDQGGRIIFTGTPDQLALCKQSITGQFLQNKIVGSPKPVKSK